MPDQAAWWAATALSAAAAVLVAANVWMVGQVQSEAAQLDQARAFSAQTPQLARAAELAATTLGRAAAGADDAELKALLAGAGITISPAAAQP